VHVIFGWSRIIRWAGRVVCMGHVGSANKIGLQFESERREHLEDPDADG
jgi:hypothetical protein